MLGHQQARVSAAVTMAVRTWYHERVAGTIPYEAGRIALSTYTKTVWYYPLLYSVPLLSLTGTW